MATLYPTAVDDATTLPNPTGNNAQNSPDHASEHANANDAIKAIESKLGTGASTPANNTILIGNGTGSSAYSSLTSAQLAARISDETGTGSLVFATTPTLVTPKVDTINEATGGNGTTVGGVNLKSGALNTSNSVVTSNITDSAVTTAKIAAAAVTANKLATGAASSTVLTQETTTSTSYVDLLTATDTVTVTIGTNGLALVNLFVACTNSGANYSLTSFAASGTNTVVAADTSAIAFNGTLFSQTGASFLLTSLNPGSTTFKMKYSVTGGTGTFKARRISVVPL